MIKEDAKILDATAGNRMIWHTKDDPRILWIDIEPELEIKPDRVMDCTKTDFKDKSFNFIVFDPPHGYGEKAGDTHLTCRNKKEIDVRNAKYNMNMKLAYYGWDKYRSAPDLMRFIYLSQKEFQRILADNGLLFMKWNEVKIPLHRALAIMNNWLLMMKLDIKDPSQTLGNSKTFWLLFMKSLKPNNQTELTP